MDYPDLVTNERGWRYRLHDQVGEGAYGKVFKARRINSVGHSIGPRVCVKLSTDQTAWHRECYFSEILHDQDDAIQVLDSFVVGGPSGHDPAHYALVFELARGSVADLFEDSALPWTEKHAILQVRGLLRALDVLHKQGALHRDITPWNVLDTNDGLKLADFGIALHASPGTGVKPLFNAWWTSIEMLLGKKPRWKVEDDLFQMGQILALLLDDTDRRKGLEPISSREVKYFSCRPEVKAVIYRALRPKQFPYASAGDMYDALSHPPQIPWGRMASVRDKRLVLTGPMGTIRRDLERQIRCAGGTVQNRVGRLTDYVVVGKRAPSFIADDRGTKLLDAIASADCGGSVRVVTEAALMSALRRQPPTQTGHGHHRTG